MNKKDIATISENVSLSPEELSLIKKLNKRLARLHNKSLNYFNQVETISYDSISSAFMSGSDPDSMAQKYAELGNQFKVMLNDISKKYQVDQLKEEQIASLAEEESIIYQISHTLSNIGKLYLGGLKRKALMLASSARDESIKQSEKYEQILKDYDLILQELAISIMDNDSISLESSIKDVETLKTLDINRKSYKTGIILKQKLIIIGMLVTTAVLMGVGIWIAI